MNEIKDAIYGGERPLYGSQDLLLENVTIEPGESALKFCKNITAINCTFKGKYPFWHNENFIIRNCTFMEGARAALWYGKNCTMRDCTVLAPKMFRELDGVDIENVDFPDAQETLWHCRNIRLHKVGMHVADYLMMHCSDIEISDYVQHGNYSFQYCQDVIIRNADIHSKDAFWNTVNVTVYDSKLDGEYLGWHSKGLHLVNCHISGTQPLCYCSELVLENCTFDADADLAFEHSDVQATIRGHITSIKNPCTGRITVDSVGEIIKDEFCPAPADCEIVVNQNQK